MIFLDLSLHIMEDYQDLSMMMYLVHIFQGLFFCYLAFFILLKNTLINDYTFIIIISLSMYIIWLSGEAMAFATTILGITIYLIFIKNKKYYY